MEMDASPGIRGNWPQLLGVVILCAIGAELLAAYRDDTGHPAGVAFSVVFFGALYGAPALFLVTALGCGVGKSFDLSRMRYGKVILLADADSDGHHISTLLLTFLFRHLPQLITAGKVYLAQPPLYRIDIGKETFWALDDAHKDQILKNKTGRATPEITRFKGLGEMMPKVLWETTLNPRTRRLLRVDIADQLVTDRVMNELMGKDASARFRFIMDRAEDAQELDV